MLKKILIIVGILLGVLLIAITAIYFYFKPGEDKVLNFIKDHPQNSSMLVVRDGQTLAQYRTKQLMPLASTVKVIIAIEYAEQAAAGILDPDEQIPLSEVDKFYVPETDGGAHELWLQKAHGSVVDNKVSIREIAKGMIRYSSNANTEWLLSRLSTARVNQRLDALGLRQHTPLYPIVSALFVGKELFPGVKGKDLEQKLKALSMQEYIAATERIHERLLADTAYKHDLGDLSLEIQRIWSDRLPASTVQEYVSVMQKINSRSYFNAGTQTLLEEVMEFLLEHPANKKWLEHAGMKGGSTAFVLTKALYATDTAGHRTELAYFFNGLTALQQAKLQISMNEFELKLLTDSAFRLKLQQAFPPAIEGSTTR